MDAQQFTADVKPIPVDSIDPSPDNPRGAVQEDASFERLVSSISEVGGILVPIVVRDKGERFELVDGERRFRAAKRLRLKKVPAHVLDKNFDAETIRKYMFHLHMTREQWGALAQCKSLAEMYPELDKGIKFEEKPRWFRRIANETWMNAGTARDRVHVLAWPKKLRERVLEFDSEQPDRDIYSYVLALEVSIVEPSVKCFPKYYNHNKPPESTANQVRASLFAKTVRGIETANVTSRDEIRRVGDILQPDLEGPTYKAAIRIFEDLVDREDYFFDDALAAAEAKAPELLAEKPPKPQKILGSVKSLAETLKNYDVRYIDASVKRETTRIQLKRDLSIALGDLARAAKNLKDRLG